MNLTKNTFASLFFQVSAVVVVCVAIDTVQKRDLSLARECLREARRLRLVSRFARAMMR